MRSHLLVALSLSTLLACSKDKKSEGEAPAKPEATQPAAKVAATPDEAVKPEAARPAEAARDPRIAKIFDEGKDCTWSEQGMTKCESAKAIKDLAFQNQSSSELAASCAAALKDPAPAVRGLAATCMQGFNDNTLTPLLGAGLDAYEAESEVGLQHLFAWSFGSGNASKGGVEERYIALIEKLGQDAKTERHASFLYRSLFPQYMMASSAPSKAAGDFAIKMAKEGNGAVKDKAIESLGLLQDRAEEACSVLIEATTEETWTKTVPPMGKLGGPCVADVDSAIGFISTQLETGTFFVTHSSALRGILRSASLSKAQLDKLKKAAKKNIKANKDKKSDTPQKIYDEIAAYTDPAKAEAAK